MSCWSRGDSSMSSDRVKPRSGRTESSVKFSQGKIVLVRQEMGVWWPEEIAKVLPSNRFIVTYREEDDLQEVSKKNIKEYDSHDQILMVKSKAKLEKSQNGRKYLEKFIKDIEWANYKSSTTKTAQTLEEPDPEAICNTTTLGEPETIYNSVKINTTLDVPETVCNSQKSITTTNSTLKGPETTHNPPTLEEPDPEAICNTTTLREPETIYNSVKINTTLEVPETVCNSQKSTTTTNSTLKEPETTHNPPTLEEPDPEAICNTTTLGEPETIYNSVKINTTLEVPETVCNSQKSTTTTSSTLKGPETTHNPPTLEEPDPEAICNTTTLEEPETIYNSVKINTTLEVPETVCNSPKSTATTNSTLKGPETTHNPIIMDMTGTFETTCDSTTDLMHGAPRSTSCSTTNMKRKAPEITKEASKFAHHFAMIAAPPEELDSSDSGEDPDYVYKSVSESSSSDQDEPIIIRKQRKHKYIQTYEDHVSDSELSDHIPYQDDVLPFLQNRWKNMDQGNNPRADKVSSLNNRDAAILDASPDAYINDLDSNFGVSMDQGNNPCADKVSSSNNRDAAILDASPDAYINDLDSNFGVSKRGKIKDGCKQVYDKINYCYYCEKGIKSKITRHLLSLHKDEEKIRSISRLPKRSQQRLIQFEVIVNEGNFKHNIDVLKKKKGFIVVARRSGAEKGTKPKDYLPCEFCKKFVLLANLWHHRRNCAVWKYYFQSEDEKKTDTDASNQSVRRGRNLLQSALLEEDGNLVNFLDRIQNDEVKDVIISDTLIKRYAVLKMEGLGDKEDQKTNDVYTVTQKARTLVRLVLEAKKINKNGIINMDSLLKPENFDLVVKCAKRMSHERDVLSLGRFLGNLLGHIIQVKIGQSLRNNNEVKIKEASGFQKLYESEWNNRVNSVCLKKHNILKRKQLQTIPITEDLKTFRQFITDNMKSAKDSLNTDRTFENWNRLSKLTLCRLILFNKRRRAEVIELKVDDYEKRPKWNEDTNQEIMLSLSKTDQILSRRMDMMISGGKSRKNVDAYVLFPPDCKQSVDLMMATRAEAGIRHSNPYLFARHYSDTPLSGNLEMRELAESCPGLKYPERINSRLLRKYTATVSQILDMTDKELEVLAKHLGHDVRTHKDFYRLNSSTLELSKVSQMLIAIDAGELNRWKDKRLSDIDIEDLPGIEIEDRSDTCTDNENMVLQSVQKSPLETSQPAGVGVPYESTQV